MTGIAADGSSNGGDLAAQLRVANDLLKRSNEDLLQRNAELDEARNELSNRLEEIEGIYDNAAVGMAMFDRDRRYIRVNSRLAELNGVSKEDHIGKTAAVIVPEMAALIDDMIDRVFETGEPVRHNNVIGSAQDEGKLPRIYDLDWYAVRNGGNITAVNVIVDDVTERQRDELMIRHMGRELQHRVKNSLANVMALVEQATRSQDSDDNALAVLKNRVTALAVTHGRLTERNWQSMELFDMVEQELMMLVPADCYALDGPDVEFGAQPALAMSMALHELTSNARKHGALSGPDGRIDVSWKLTGEAGREMIDIIWCERGDSVEEAQSQNGFGSRLIATSIRNALRGTLTEQRLDDGMCYSISIPYDFVKPAKEALFQNR